MTKKVLLIELSAEIRENVGELLALNGFEVINAANGLFGYELALATHPDIILCDTMVPGTDRELFLKIVKEHPVLSAIPLILFSADISTPGALTFRSKDADIVLQKPFTGEDLLAAILRSLADSTQNTACTG